MIWRKMDGFGRRADVPLYGDRRQAGSGWSKNQQTELAIDAAFTPIEQAEESGRTLVQGRRIINVLEQWLEEVDQMVLPPDTSMGTPQPPGGGGGGGGTGG